jgi:hypothetical protein
VRRKSFSHQIHRAGFVIVTITVVLYAAAPSADSAESVLKAAPKYLGATACASSGCHGGAGHDQNQFLVWSLRDFHSQRPSATLTTARSKHIADALQISDPAADNRCTSCHSPLQDVPAALRAATFKVSEAVSCESCHGPAEHWLRSHTRPDYTHTDRVASGMRDLKNLYVRANACIACHQTAAPTLRTAGHPELIFELDGQCVAQPKHWREKTNWHGAQAWLVGQAAALREMCWQLATSVRHDRDEKLAARADALLWLLGKLDATQGSIPRLSASGVGDGAAPSRPDYSTLHSAADKLSRAAAEVNWSGEMTLSILAAFANTGADFRAQLPAQQHALRAERLVLALDRLLASKPRPAAEASVSDLFKLSQSLPDFDPGRFSATLDKLALTVD